MEVSLELPSEDIEWKAVLGVDLAHFTDPTAAPSYVARTFNAILPSILYGNYRSLEDHTEEDDFLHKKALHLAQLNAQILYQTQTTLTQRATQLSYEIDQATLRLKQTHEDFTRRKSRRKLLRKRVEELTEACVHYRLLLSAVAPEEVEEEEHRLSMSCSAVEEIAVGEAKTPPKRNVGWLTEEDDSVLIGTIEKKEKPPSVMSVDSLNAKAEEEEAEDSVLTGTL